MFNATIKKIKDNWQLLATLLIMWSIFDLYNYYIRFGIDIQQYLNVSEILLLTFPAFLHGIVAIIILFIFITFGLRKKSKDPEIEKNHLAMDEYHPELFQFKKHFIEIRDLLTPFKLKNIFPIFMWTLFVLIETAVILFILTIGYFIFKIFISKSLEFYPVYGKIRFVMLYFITYFFLIPVFLLISDIIEKHTHNAFSDLTIKKYPIIYFTIMLIINGLISNQVQYLSIINGRSNKIISFIYNENKIVTDSTLVFIGGTKDYIFLRNCRDSTSIIYKRDEINNLSIKPLKGIK